MKKKLFSLIFTTLLSLMAGILLFVGNTAQALSVNSRGEINNLVCFVNFADKEEFVTDNYLSTMDEMYNTSPISVKNYFSEVSMGQLSLTTHFLSPNGESVQSVKLENPIEYYMPRYETYASSYREINSQGYDNRKYDSSGNVNVNGTMTHVESFYREQMMVREIINDVKSALNPSLALDNNGDLSVDSITFILNCDAGNWNDLLWPHMTQFQSVNSEYALKGVFYFPANYFSDKPLPGESPYLNGVKCNYYDLQLSGYIFRSSPSVEYPRYGDIGVLAHELMHIVGAPDLYRYYNDKSVEPVGELDIMDATDYLPQYPLTYIRQKLGWAQDGVNILPINSSGTYTLEPVNSNSALKAYKIVLPDYEDTGEYFMLEVRNNSGSGFDSSLSSSGLIIYRVDESAGKLNESGVQESDGNYGNMYGPPDEVYVYRNLNADTVGENAYFGNSIVKFGSQNDGVMPKDDILFYQGRESGSRSVYRNKNSGIVVSDITISQDSSVTFNVTLPKDEFQGEDYSGLTKVAFSQGIQKYPYLVRSSLSETGVDVKFKSPYASQTAYFIVTHAQSEMPTFFQVKKGVDYGGNKVFYQGSVDMLKSITEYTAKVSGLNAGTEYKIYLVLGSETTYSSVYFGEFTTKQDTNPPEITFTLPPSAEVGSEIDIGLNVTDNVSSADEISVTISIQFNGEIISRSDVFTVNKTGVYTVTVTASDGYGNSDSVVKSINVIDTVPPQIQINLPLYAQTESIIRLEPIVKDAGTISSEIEVSIKVYFAGELFVENVSSFIPVQAGLYHIEITAKDGAGNCDVLNKNIEVSQSEVVDVTEPAVSVDALSPREGDTVKVKFAASDNVTAYENLIIQIFITKDGKLIEYDNLLQFTALAGDYRVLVTCKDEAGNVGQDTVEFTVLDKTLPSIEIQVPSIAKAGEDIEIKVNASDNYTQENQLRYKIEVIKDTVTIKDSFVFSLDKGVYTIKVTVYDGAGNFASDEKTITVDERKSLSFSNNYPKITQVNKSGFTLGVKLQEGGYSVKYLVFSDEHTLTYEDFLNIPSDALAYGTIEVPYAAIEKVAQISGLTVDKCFVYVALYGENADTDIVKLETELKEPADRFDFSCDSCSDFSSGKVISVFMALAMAAAVLFKRK